MKKLLLLFMFTISTTYVIAQSGTYSIDTNAFAPRLNPKFLGTVTGINSTMVGLGNVQNTTDANKPISALTATALLGKQNLLNGTGLVKSTAGVISYDNSTYASLTAFSSSVTGLTYNNVTGVFSSTVGYSIPLNSDQANWSVSYLSRITSLTNIGSSGAATMTANVLNIPNYTLSGLGGQPQLSGTGLVRFSGTSVIYDNTPYFASTGGTITGNVGLGNTPTEKLEISGNLYLDAPGNKIKIATGTNASIGTATLVNGTVTINTTAVKTGSLVWVQYHGVVSTACSVLAVSTITDTTSFVINAITGGSNTINTTDTNTVKWWVIN